MNRWVVYTLLLANECIYVGVTGNLDRRLWEHFSGVGAARTRLNPPLDVVWVSDPLPQADAKALETEEYYRMKSCHGRKRVRGAGNTRSI